MKKRCIERERMKLKRERFEKEMSRGEKLKRYGKLL